MVMNWSKWDSSGCTCFGKLRRSEKVLSMKRKSMYPILPKCAAPMPPIEMPCAPIRISFYE